MITKFNKKTTKKNDLVIKILSILDRTVPYHTNRLGKAALKM